MDYCEATIKQDPKSKFRTALIWLVGVTSSYCTVDGLDEYHPGTGQLHGKEVTFVALPLGDGKYRIDSAEAMWFWCEVKVE